MLSPIAAEAAARALRRFLRRVARHHRCARGDVQGRGRANAGLARRRFAQFRRAYLRFRRPEPHDNARALQRGPCTLMRGWQCDAGLVSNRSNSSPRRMLRVAARAKSAMGSSSASCATLRAHPDARSALCTIGWWLFPDPHSTVRCGASEQREMRGGGIRRVLGGGRLRRATPRTAGHRTTSTTYTRQHSRQRHRSPHWCAPRGRVSTFLYDPLPSFRTAACASSCRLVCTCASRSWPVPACMPA